MKLHADSRLDRQRQKAHLRRMDDQPVIPFVTEEQLRCALRQEWIDKIKPSEWPEGMGDLTFVPQERDQYFELNPKRQ